MVRLCSVLCVECIFYRDGSSMSIYMYVQYNLPRRFFYEYVYNVYFDMNGGQVSFDSSGHFVRTHESSSNREVNIKYWKVKLLFNPTMY